MSVGKVYIIGAGCGKYDLISLRGMNALKNCNVILYDSLIDRQLLDLLPGNCKKNTSANARESTACRRKK